jgi:hypothetical protein
MKRRHTTANPPYSIVMGKNYWIALLQMAATGIQSRDGHYASSRVEWTLGKHRKEAYQRLPESVATRLETYIVELRGILRDLDGGAEGPDVRKALRALSDVLRQDARNEQPRPDTSFNISVSIERVVTSRKSDETTQETTESIASFHTLEQASAFAGLLRSVGMVIAVNDPEQLVSYGWRI